MVMSRSTSVTDLAVPVPAMAVDRSCIVPFRNGPSSISTSPPVSTSSRRRVSIADPIPRSSRTRPVRTSSATGAGVARISSAARRYARTL